MTEERRLIAKGLERGTHIAQPVKGIAVVGVCWWILCGPVELPLPCRRMEGFPGSPSAH